MSGVYSFGLSRVPPAEISISRLVGKVCRVMLVSLFKLCRILLSK